jgi:hypothetical protein
MLKIDEITRDDGTLEGVHLHASPSEQAELGELVLVTPSRETQLPAHVLAPVMRRYGLPFDPDEAVSVVGTLDLGGARSLRHVRHLARYDVIAKDYLVYEEPGAEPICALATTVAGALAHLAGVASRARELG